MQDQDVLFLDGYKWTNVNFTWKFEAVGGSPAIITIPHDGGFHPSDLLGLLESRKDGVKVRDMHVWPIVKGILLKTRVNAVRVLFSRHFIDYNRSPKGINYYPLSQAGAEKAFDDENLRGIYDSYHHAIVDFLMKTIKMYGKEKCLLIDLHGFTNQPPYGEYDLILGTGNRITVNSNVDRLFADFFSARGYRVFLPEEKNIGSVEDKYNAEFTARHYAEKFGIDTLQIEVAKRLRIPVGSEVSRRLSSDVAEFIRLYFNF